MAPLQKRAFWSLLIGSLLTIALVVVFLLAGDVNAFERDDTLRWVTYAALIGVPLAYWVLIDLTLRKPTQLDERDRLIMLRAGRVQWLAVILSLAAWMIALTEVYQAARNVPLVYLTLLFISTLIVSVLGQSLGILLGYRSAGRDG